MNAPVGIGNVAGITWEAPLVVAAGARFDLLLVPAELFAGTLGAVVFAINFFLYGGDDKDKNVGSSVAELRAHQKDERTLYRCRGDPPDILGGLFAPGHRK